MTREEKIKLYGEYKIKHFAKVSSVAKFQIGDKVKWNTSRGINLFAGIVFEIEKIDIDHTHGSFDGVDCGHTEKCYCAECVDYSLVAYANDGSPIRTRYTQGFIVNA